MLLDYMGNIYTCHNLPATDIVTDTKIEVRLQRTAHIIMIEGPWKNCIQCKSKHNSETLQYKAQQLLTELLWHFKVA